MRSAREDLRTRTMLANSQGVIHRPKTRSKVDLRATQVAHVDDADGLSALSRPEIAAAIWTRRLAPALQAWIDGLSPERLPSGRAILRPRDVDNTLHELCEIAQTPCDPERDLLIEDAATLARTFTDLTGAQYLRLRFDIVDNDACRKFHIDTVTARLICTYRGPGTQYGLAMNGSDPDRVFSVPTGSPICLKGKLWPGLSRSELVHRSPPIDGTGETRSLFVIDQIFDPEKEL